MAKYNRTFDLSIDDMDLIETALRTAARVDDDAGVCPKEANELLGRLHNQKIFYRPRNGIYISG